MPASAPPKRPNRLHIWMRAVRAPSLIFAVLPVLLGGGLTLIDRGFDGWPFLITMIAVMLLQAGTNLFNDYFGLKKGADAPDDEAYPSVLMLGWLAARQVLIGGLICYLLASVLGIYLIYIGGWPILLLGVIGIAAGYCFSATRYALSYHWLGELTVFFCTGPLLVFGTYYLMVTIVYPYVFLNGVSVGLLAAATLHVNNLADLEHDRRIGKHTLSTLLGAQCAKRLYELLLLLAYLVPVALWYYDLTPVTSLLSLLTFPLAVHTVRKVRSTSDPIELNLVVGLCGLLQLLFGILYVFGIYVYYFTHI